MPRGRPKIEQIEYEEVEKIIAHLFTLVCGIPGCVAKAHYHDARSFVSILEKANYKIVKDGN